MSIKLTHFCTLTGKHKLIDEENNIELSEKLDSCVLEELMMEMYPDTHQDIKYYVGTIYEGFTDIDDCVKHPGKALISSSRDHFIFASVSQEDAKAIRTELFDEELYAAQYGSNLVTNCREAAIEKHQGKKILIVDGETGECGGTMPPEQARLLVGDGDGRISTAFAAESDFEKYSQSQVRGFIYQQPDSNFPKTCLVKGTLTPTEDLGGYDLVLSTDQVGKGRKSKETKVKPGEYTLDISLGVVKYAARAAVSDKSIEKLSSSEFVPNPINPSNAENEFSQSYGLSRTGIQFWNCLPESGRGFASLIIEDRLKELRDMQSDPRKIAWDYVKGIESRIRGQVKEQIISDMIASDLDIFDLPDNAADDLFEELAAQNSTYIRIKTDLENHFQLIEGTDIEFLNDYIRKEYVACATGAYVKFNYGMLKTNNSLADGEIRVPHLPENETVVFYRPPVPNSNVIGTLTNNRLVGEEAYPGTIEMSRKTYDALNADTDGDQPIFASKHEVCTRYAQKHAEWYAEYTGDTAGFQAFYDRKLEEYSSAFDGFVAEIRFYQQPENRYKKITTPDKAPYEHDTFEETALAGIKNSVGRVANKSMQAIALEKEVDYLPRQEKVEYIYSTIKHIDKFLPDIVVDQETGETRFEGDNLINLDEKEIRNIKALSERIEQINIKNAPQLDETEIAEALSSLKGVTRNIVDVLAQQLEIEVQSEKSARRCDEDTLKICTEYLSFRPIAALADRKNEFVYRYKTALLDESNFTVSDNFSKLTNSAFKETELVRRPGAQFKHLFQGVEYEPSLLAQELRNSRTVYAGVMSDVFDNLSKLNRQAIVLDNDVKRAKTNNIDLWLNLTNSNDVKLEIAVSKKAYDNFDLHNIKSFEKLQLIRDEKDKNKFLVSAALKDSQGNIVMQEGNKYPKRKAIGELTQRWLNDNKELIGEWLRDVGKGRYISLGNYTWTAEIIPVPSRNEVTAAKQTARLYASEVREQFEGSSMAAAAALFHIDTSKRAGYNLDESKKNEIFWSDKITRNTLKIFPEQVA
jgi:hypothetical protein